MKTSTLAPETEAELWLSILHPDRQLTPGVARVIVDLDFPQSDIARMHELSAKARTGNLTPEENAEMDDFERVGAMLSILKSKSRQIIKGSRRLL